MIPKSGYRFSEKIMLRRRSDTMERIPARSLTEQAWCALGGSAADVSHGLARESLDMDGIREDVHYGTGANWQGGGVYAGPITVLRNRRDDIDLTRLRFRYQNTLGERVTVPPDAVIPQQPYEQLVCTPLPQIP